MSKAVAKAQMNTGLQVAPEPPPQEILSTDILIPKLLLMQGLSEFVSERKAGLGDMIRSTTVEKLGDPEHPIDFIPLKTTAEYREEEKVGGKFEFRKTIPRTGANEHLPWTFYRNPLGQEFEVAGQQGATEWRRVKVITCYALLPRDIDAFQVEMDKAQKTGEMPDLNKTVLPIVISFRSTSFNAGKSVSTFFAQVEEMKKYAAQVRHYYYTLPLSCFGDKNDKGAYYVFQVGKPSLLAEKYRPVAERWYQTLSALKEIKVDEAADREAPVEGGTF